jgi:peptidoglycan hydrolase-like protein with peptidoglycan-binding domain
MKKAFITSIVALALILGSAASANAAITSYMSVGSSGAQVSELQTWLIAKGFDIPAISSGAAAKGYFGQQTKAAVVKYQMSVGLPSTGFFGPLTLAKVNGTGGVSMTPVSCPAGYVCTPAAGTTPVVIANPGTITTPGVAGTITFVIQGSPSGASLDKGESEDVVRYKLQSSASDMQVTSIALDFDTRLWLYASAVTIKDDSGAVIATKSNLNANDFTELTVGSSYRLYVPVNYVVPKTQTRYLTVNVTALQVTDRSSATLTVTSAQIRAVDGTGVTDTQTEATDRTFSYTGTNTGNTIATINAASPLKRLVQISNSAETKDVVLAKYDLKSQNRDTTLRSLKLYVRTTGAADVSTLFTRVRLQIDGNYYSANDTSADNDGVTNTASSTLTFTDLRVALAKDTAKTITVVADVADPASDGLFDGVAASTTLLANSTNIAIEDNTYNTVTVNSGTLVSSDTIFSANGAMLSGLSATASGVGNTSATYNVAFNFSITAGDNALYVSRSLFSSAGAAQTVSTSTTGSLTARLTTLVANPSEMPGDTSTEYVVAAGSTRSFTISGSATGSAGASGTVKIDSIKYGTTSGTYSQTINYNLGALQTNSLTIGS